ncbi:MAG TPA: BON domain-containing protein [Candidatus Xenobia bacterium]|jgi:osmotically-inducible protein OsmY
MRYAQSLVGLAVVGLLAGCSGTTRQKADQTTQSVKSETRQVGQRASQDLAEGTQTLRVKTALAASKALSGATIHVTSEPHRVILKGSVLTENQKTVAGQLAKDTVGAGVTIVNDLALEKRAAKAR